MADGARRPGGLRRVPDRRAVLPRCRRASPTTASGSSPVETVKPLGPRAVGEVLVDMTPRRLGPLPTLTGFENHGGATAPSRGTARWGRWWSASATASATGPRARSPGRVVGTYLHGPCWRATRRWPTACSPGRWARSRWPASDDDEAEDLREERLATVGGRRRRRRRG